MRRLAFPGHVLVTLVHNYRTATAYSLAFSSAAQVAAGVRHRSVRISPSEQHSKIKVEEHKSWRSLDRFPKPRDWLFYCDLLSESG